MNVYLLSSFFAILTPSPALRYSNSQMLLPPLKTLPHLLSHLPPQTLTLTPTLPSILHARLLRTNLLFLPHPSHPPWNALLAAFARHAFPSLALQTLSLIHRLPLPLDSYALCTSLTAATATARPAIQIHGYAFKSGWLSSVFVGGALIDHYVKLNSLENARRLFGEMSVRTTICVNALLSGYVAHGLWEESVYLIRRMHRLGLEPDGVTLSMALRACEEGADFRLGVQVHAYLVRRMECDAILLSSLVEMYGKCGMVEKAHIVFEVVARGGRDVVLWTSMLNAYGRNGRFGDMIEAFEEMVGQGTKPDELAFLAVLSGCGHCGCVSDGLKYFESMRSEYGMVPTPEHVGCVVDMLCRAGELEKAWDVANEMVIAGIRVGVSVWVALLTACKDRGNVEIGKVAAQRALEVEPANAGIYTQLSNLYASVGMWGEIGGVRELIKEQGLKKDVGRSWL